MYFGTNRELEVENLAELNDGQQMDSYVASSQSLRSLRYSDIAGAVAEYLSVDWTFLVTVVSSTSSWHTADGNTIVNGSGATIVNMCYVTIVL
jgi:hypothetical protein